MRRAPGPLTRSRLSASQLPEASADARLRSGARRLAARLALSVALGPVAVGCGGAAAPSQEPASAPATPAAEAEWAPGQEAPGEAPGGAWLELDRAEQQLADALGGAPPGAAGTTPPMGHPTRATDGSSSDAEAPLSQGPTFRDRCEVACAAFQSMQRAAERVCELAGSDEARCLRAGERIGRARLLVREACPTCGDVAD